MLARFAVLLSVAAICLSACVLPGLPIGQHKSTPAPDKPASQYFAEAINGYDTARGIRLTEVVGRTTAFGNVTGGSIDLQGQGFHATLTADHGPIELVSSAGSPVFVKASADYWRQAGHGPEAKVLDGYWTKLVTGSEAGALRSLMPREFAREDRLRPKNLTKGRVTNVPGTPAKALPLSAPQPGKLYVTQGSPARLVRVEKLSTGDWESFTASVAYDDSTAVQEPSADVLDPSDPATLPARYVSAGRAALPQCNSSDASCREGFNLTNQNGPQRPGTKSTVKVHFEGSGNDEFASCVGDVPAVGTGQSTTGSCEIPTGVLVGYLNAHNTSQYFIRAEVHNAIWDD
ncbi:MAG: hypothetical protein M3072_08665 [Candidatus Dormibacteraeota bacterium]|nr:hypothetical protein [Candidatus Dormibacteraeota bacterium]